jgi:hypothetical protein
MTKSPKDRTVSTDDLNAISLEVKHIEQLAVLAIQQLEPQLDDESDTLLTLVVNQTKKIQDMINVMFKAAVTKETPAAVTKETPAA